MSLQKFSGEWNLITAKHLLNRATFDPSNDNILACVNQGLEASVDELLMDRPLPPLPVNPEYDVPNIPIGESWVGKPDMQENITIWFRSMRYWHLKIMKEEGRSAREKMTLFFHNHFVSSPDEPMQYRYKYHDLLRRYCFGDVKALTKEITITPSMLVFLNGETNSADAPNENYARELLELFTVGKGDTIGPGDYSTFTEDDVFEAAKILTGWTIDFSFESGVAPKPIFNPELHDNSAKQLSGYFDNAIIENGGATEYEQLIDVIFDSQNTALKIIRDIYIWFVHYDINETVEEEIIKPLAQLFIDSNFVLKPVLKVLFESKHFYSESLIGGKIKSPYELIIGFTNTFDISVPHTLSEEFRLLYGLSFPIEDMGQALSKLPTVAGWKAYYQSPGFYKNWIDSITLPLRMSFLETAIQTGHTIIHQNYQVDILDFVLKIENATDPIQMIKNIGDILYSFPLSDEDIARYKSVLIPGLPDFEWTVEYGEYLGDPENEQKKIAIENRLKDLLIAMIVSPSFQLH